MKKVINWTAGSFFRTIGRILGYLGIALIIFFILEKTGAKGISILKLDAATTNQVYYNYNDDYVIENSNKNWFGENGTLEQIKNQLINNGLYGHLGFGSNGIWFIPDKEIYNTGVFSSITNSSSSIKISFTNHDATSVTRYIYYYNNYSSVNNFVASIINENGRTTICNRTTGMCSLDLVTSTNDDDYRSTSFNIFSQDINSWNVIYYSNVTIDNTCHAMNYGCRNHTINDISINGNTSFITYFDLRGNIAPSEDINKTRVYNTLITIDPSHIDEAAGGFQVSISNGEIPIINEIKIYGLVNDNDLYHYELLDSSIISLKNSNPNYGTSGYDYSYSSGGIYTRTYDNIQNVLYMAPNSFNHIDLSSYEEIYVKIEYENPFYINVGTFRTQIDSPYIKQILVNDVCSNCLFLQLTTQGSNSYLFSNSDSSQETQLYYSDIISNDVIYASPVFINLKDKSVINDDVVVYTNRYYYTKFNKVEFNKNKIAKDVGLTLHLYMNETDNVYNPSGAYQMLYYITPNLYWSITSYADDRSSVTGCYINEDTGESDCLTLEGDYHNYSSEIPVGRYFNVLKGIMSEDFYGLSGLLLAPLDYIRSLNEQVCSSIHLPIPFTDTDLIIPCLSSVYNEYIPSILNLWHVVIYGILSYYIGVHLFRIIKNSLEADKNDVEVLSL